MKIMLIHNYYQQPGGEDQVFDAEAELLSSKGHIVEKLEFDNKVIRTPINKLATAFGTLYNVTSAKRLQERILSFAPDVIHVHNFIALASPSIFFIAKKYGVPVVLTLHNYRLICPSATLFYNNAIYEKSIHARFPIDAIRKGVYRNSHMQTAALALMTGCHQLLGTWKNKIDRYIVLTQFAKEKFMESSLQVPECKLVVKPNFVIDHGNSTETRENFFLFVGRLTPEKGIETLLDAAQSNKFNVTIMGDGPLREKVEEAQRNSPNITYLGFRPKENILTELKRCKALLFPSTWYEGFPISILEAFSTGTPVIASRLGSMAEIVQDHSNGLHFEAGQSEDLARAILDIANNDELGERLGSNARQTYLLHYTADVNYNRLLDIYNTVIMEKVRAHSSISGQELMAAS